MCLDSLALRTKEDIVFACVWVRTLVACMDIVFSVCLGSLVLRTKNIHCTCVCLGTDACMDIAFSVCLGSLVLRTKNIHCVSLCLGWHVCMDIVFSVFGFARFKNEEYTLDLRLFGFLRLSLGWTLYLACVWVCSF